MDICFISHSASIGGAEEVLVETLEVLSNRGMNCRVLLPERGKLCDELNRLRIPFSIVPYGCWVSRGKQDFWKRLKSIARHLATIPAIVWLIRQWSCDVVYSNTSTICVGAIVAAILRRPHVWHIHEFGYEDHGLLFLFGERFSLKVMNLLSSTCICPSQAVKAKYARFIPPSKLNMLYCSMHHAREKGGGEDKATLSIPLRRHSFRCVIVGSVIEGKGQEEAVNAIAELAGSNMKAELLIVGRDYGSYGQRLKEIVACRNLGEQVVFVGHVDDPSPFIQSADVVLVCSKREAFGRVTIEAMLLGRPVIGAQSGATSEIVKEGFNGLLYIPGDPKSLADKIRTLYEDPELATRMGANGKKWAELIFTEERYARELCGLLTSLKRPVRLLSQSNCQ